MQFLRSKVALALIGICLIGGASAILAAQVTLSQEAALIAANVTQNTTYANTSVPTGTSAGTTTSTDTSTATVAGSGNGGGGGGGGGGQKSPTSTPIIVPPTATPRPPTPTPAPGQTIRVDGNVASKDTAGNTFTVTVQRIGQPTYTETVDVNGSTQFTNTVNNVTSPSTFSALQVNWQTSVTCTNESTNRCLASRVDSGDN